MLNKFFSKFADRVSHFAGSPWAFIFALLLIVGWGLTGPFFSFSTEWSLFINSVTTIFTFIMVFLIQHTQNKETKAIQIKLNALIVATQNLSNRFANIENLSEEEIIEAGKKLLEDAYCE